MVARCKILNNNFLLELIVCLILIKFLKVLIIVQTRLQYKRVCEKVCIYIVVLPGVLSNAITHNFIIHSTYLDYESAWGSV